MQQKKKGGFTSSLGFILSAAGSAVGLGNLWRFPYLAASGGGGLFLLIYLILAITFGYTLLSTELAIGRRTGKSSLSAYKTLFFIFSAAVISFMPSSFKRTLLF